MNWSRRDAAVLWHPFTSMQEWIAGSPLVIERAEGNYLLDDGGRRYFDAVSSLWVTVHGHCHPAIIEAVSRQLRTLDHSTMLGLAHPRSIELGERLVALAPPGLRRVFYSESGSTAVEIAIKQAFQYWANRGVVGKHRFLHLADSYHGDTLGAVGVGGIPVFHEVFGPIVVEGIRIPSPAPGLAESGEVALARGLRELEAVLSTRAADLAAFVLEPLVQGAAGMLVHPAGYLRGAAALCRKYDVLLIVDEVATGFGRTGRMFACEHEGVTPDLMCLAKGITGGVLPLAATLCTDAVFEAFLAPRRDLRTFFHGHTYTGNPVACAAALANLDLFEAEQTLTHVRNLEAWIEGALSRLAHSPWVGGRRRCGTMVGFDLVDRARPFAPDRFMGSQVCERARDHGVILRPLGDTIVWMPPLSTTEAEVDLLYEATAAAIAEKCSSPP
jgi:adenosylmethionine---8-amino-7-oxononanoate aminotransferase